MRASTAIVDVQPQPEERYVRERNYCASELCTQCKRGHMHRAHRHTTLDFLLSLVGIFPIRCGYCNASGQKLQPIRPVLLLGAATLALGSYIAHGLWAARVDATAVQMVNPKAHQQGSRAPARAVFDDR